MLTIQAVSAIHAKSVKKKAFDNSRHSLMRKYLLFEIFGAWKSFTTLITTVTPQAKCFIVMALLIV